MSITITAAAATKLKQILEAEGSSELKLRISITGGGCSGFKYNFSFDESVYPDDTVIDTEMGSKILVDAMSGMYLVNAIIDFKDSAAGEEFIIRNPQAKTTCGCGSSFSIE